MTQRIHAYHSEEYSAGTHKMVIGRANPKEHGSAKDRYFIGDPSDADVVVLEDVTTTGGSLIRTIDSLVEAGSNVIAAIGLTNKMEKRDDGLSVKEAIEAKGVPYHHLSSGLSLLPQAYQRSKPGEEIGRAIEQEFQRYGVEPLQIR